MTDHPNNTQHRIPANLLRAWRRCVVAGIIGLSFGPPGTTAAPLPDAQDPAPFDERIYIVQLAAPPALTYSGKPGGLAATRPLPGRKFNPRAFNVRQYTAKLLGEHNHVLQSVGAYDNKVYSYRYTFNGFAARLTTVQAQKLKSRKDVLNVWEDQVRYLATNNSPVFLGLYDAADGLAAARGLNGEDIVIGVIDSGIAPEHPSFADTVKAARPRLCQSSWAESSLLGLWLCQRFKNRDDQLVYEPLAGWNGSCEPGENFTAEACNNKIIGARFYVDGFLNTFVMDENEFLSPRDADGHGTHIASTAAGSEVRATLAGNDIDRVLGMAPRARIAVYKACWLEPGQERGSCTTSDLQRAIEDAVADGVDIINYSVGNTDISISDPDDLALLAASNAGVLAVVAAGNDGPAAGTILSPSGAPWVLTVGASSRTGDKFDEAMRVNSPGDVAGTIATLEASFTPPLRDNGAVTEALVLVDDDVTAGGTEYDGCTTLINGSEITGKIAFLQRGSCDFEVKLKNAATAGAVAVVVFSNAGDPIVMAGTRGSVDIPAVMINQSDGQRLLASLQNGDTVDVTLDKEIILIVPDDGNMLANFSSRGPNLTAADILKPDVIAPGVDILAGQTPDVANGIRGELFQYLSGTSMSTPHVAGIAALIKQAHPDWSPAAIKSALVTTGRQDIVKGDGQTPADPFDIGGGHVVPNLAVDPGLIYDAGKEDYEAFLCGLNVPGVAAVIDDATCTQLIADGHPTAATDLNQPSIAVSALVAEQTVRRYVTAVGEPAQYTVEIDPPPGIIVTVNPAVLSLAAGESAAYDVTLSTATANLTTWQFGSLRWTSPNQSVRSPIAVRPMPFTAPFVASGTGASGELSFDVRFGYTGTYTATAAGLTAPLITANLTVAGDQSNTYVQFDLGDTLPSTIWRSPENLLVVNEGDTHLRVALFDEHTSGDDDLDLYVYYCPDLLACDPPWVSGSFDSNEQIDVLLPEAGNYIIDVHGFDTEAPTTTFDLFIWTVGADDSPGNLNIIPPPVAVSGETGEITVQWDGLDSETHLGTITHSDGDETLEVTVLEIRN